MNITSIETMRVAIPFHAFRKAPEVLETTFNAASSSLRKMETLLVKINTDSGAVGWGEGFGHLCNPVTERALVSLAAPFFIGKSVPQDIDELTTLMSSAEQAMHPFGRGGPVRFALSAIDIALWDLLGKRRRQSVSALQGAWRTKIRRYASLVSYDNQPEEVAKQVRRVVDEGFTSIKLHETHPLAIKAAREQMPEGAALMTDVNCPWSPEEAHQHVRELTSVGLDWIEEPIWPPDDYEALHRLREEGIAVAAGENVEGDMGFNDIIARKLIDVVQPSVAKVGGFTAALRVINNAQKHDVRVVPHCFYYGPAMLATAHLVALLPDDVELETPIIHLEAALYPDLPQGPEVDLGNASGLGFTPDIATIEKYRLTHHVIGAQEEKSHV